MWSAGNALLSVHPDWKIACYSPWSILGIHLSIISELVISTSCLVYLVYVTLTWRCLGHMFPFNRKLFFSQFLLIKGTVEFSWKKFILLISWFYKWPKNLCNSKLFSIAKTFHSVCTEQCVLGKCVSMSVRDPVCLLFKIITFACLIANIQDMIKELRQVCKFWGPFPTMESSFYILQTALKTLFKQPNVKSRLTWCISVKECGTPSCQWPRVIVHYCLSPELNYL